MGKSGTSRLLSYSLEKTSTWAWQNGDRFPIQNICSPYKTLMYCSSSLVWSASSPAERGHAPRGRAFFGDIRVIA